MAECSECGKEIKTREDWEAYNWRGICASCQKEREENMIEED